MNHTAHELYFYLASTFTCHIHTPRLSYFSPGSFFLPNFIISSAKSVSTIFPLFTLSHNAKTAPQTNPGHPNGA